MVEIACLIVIQLRLAFAVDKIFAVHSPSQTLFGPKEHTSCVCVGVQHQKQHLQRNKLKRHIFLQNNRPAKKTVDLEFLADPLLMLAIGDLSLGCARA